MNRTDFSLDEILAIVRKPSDPRAAFDSLRDIGKNRLPSEVWDKILTPNVEVDIWNAAAWIKDGIFGSRPTRVNISVGGQSCVLDMFGKPDAPAASLVRRSGETHFIEGICRTYKTLKKFDLGYPAGYFAEYLFLFGYGGVVLASALDVIKPDWDCLFIWGFDDGPWGQLAKSSSKGIVRIVQDGEMFGE